MLKGCIVPIRLSEGQRNKLIQTDGNIELKFSYEDIVNPNTEIAMPMTQYNKLQRAHSKGVGITIEIPQNMVKINQRMYDPKGGNFLSSLLPLAKMAFTIVAPFIGSLASEIFGETVGTAIRGGAMGGALGDRGVGRVIGDRVFFPESGLVIGGGISLHPYSDGIIANYDELLEGAHPYDVAYSIQGGSMFLSPWGYLQQLPELITIPRVGVVNGGSMHFSPYMPPPPPTPQSGVPSGPPPMPKVTGGFSSLLTGMLAPAVFSLAKKVLGGSLNSAKEAKMSEDGTKDHPMTIIFRHRNGSINIKPISPRTAYITLHQAVGDGPLQGLSLMHGKSEDYVEGSGLLLGENSPFKGWPIIGQLL